MATYSYKCSGCGNVFEEDLPMSEAKADRVCSCGALAKRILGSGVQFTLNGDQWPGKAITIRNQMAEKNKRLEVRRKENRPEIALAPNFEGERVRSWTEAQKIAAGKGKNVTSYDPLIQKETGK